jgi:hypothetical protein
MQKENGGKKSWGGRELNKKNSEKDSLTGKGR